MHLWAERAPVGELCAACNVTLFCHLALALLNAWQSDKTAKSQLQTVYFRRAKELLGHVQQSPFDANEICPYLAHREIVSLGASTQGASRAVD